jgi:hypothetical protein
MTASQSREGNANWLKRQLRQVQEVIIQLCEEQRMSEEIIMEHFKECGLAMENVCGALVNAQTKLALVSAQTKLKGNAVLWRQVKNLKRRNLSLRKTLRVLRL